MFKSKSVNIALGFLLGALALVGTAAILTHGDVAATATPAASAPASAPASPAAIAAPSTPAADPYAVYLDRNPRPALVLSREDAQTRAMLGCGQAWAPGTIDAVLAAAYRPTGICNR